MTARIGENANVAIPVRSKDLACGENRFNLVGIDSRNRKRRGSEAGEHVGTLTAFT